MLFFMFNLFLCSSAMFTQEAKLESGEFRSIAPPTSCFVMCATHRFQSLQTITDLKPVVLSKYCNRLINRRMLTVFPALLIRVSTEIFAHEENHNMLITLVVKPSNQV